MNKKIYRPRFTDLKYNLRSEAGVSERGYYINFIVVGGAFYKDNATTRFGLLYKIICHRFTDLKYNLRSEAGASERGYYINFIVVGGAFYKDNTATRFVFYFCS